MQKILKTVMKTDEWEAEDHEVKMIEKNYKAMLHEEFDISYFHSLHNHTMKIMSQSLYAAIHRCSVRCALLLLGATLTPY